MDLCYFLMLMWIQYIDVHARNYVIYDPEHRMKKSMDDLVIRYVKPFRHRDGKDKDAPHILDLKLIFPRAGPQEPHNPLQVHSMAQHNSGLPSALRTDTQVAGRRLAYKEDLIKAFDELEKRQQAKKCSDGNNNSNLSSSTQSNFLPLAIVTNNPNTTPCNKPNDLHDLIEIMKGGLNVNTQAPQTTEDISWMKIRVPRKH